MVTGNFDHSVGYCGICRSLQNMLILL